MERQKLDLVEATGERTVDIGDLDFRRNLKFRAFLGLALAPVFRELLPRLRYVEMGRRGVTPGQYFQDFRSHPAPHGYGDRFKGHYAIRLCRSISREKREPSAEPLRVERLVLETRATLTGSPATGETSSLGFEPSLGAPTTAGEARVLHVLTRPQSPPGKRWVTDVPEEIEFLRLHSLEESFPTIAGLAALEDGFVELTGAEFDGVWGVANTDVFQHVHAREYTMAMENGVTQCLAAAGLPLKTHLALRARTIFRRPAFVG
ncbi:MAG TPA: hypothetical protein VK433_07395, partial [Stellaceae bacterium]|nr:hypothetical protein [Stellaceae bacterium]